MMIRDNNNSKYNMFPKEREREKLRGEISKRARGKT